ncbi:MAG: hypothetical protein Q8O57_04470, partial [Kiritimatiellota bacterium]|nr:hypothetical protein [Kiritimatiellota bacterium]
MISNCLFVCNNARKGGAFYNNGTPAIWNCTFSGNNTVGAGESERNGGGINNYNGTLFMANSVICSNYSPAGSGCLGGGMFLYQGSAVISNCVFVGNGTGNSGGGVAISYNGTGMRLLTQCAFVGNTPQGIYTVYAIGATTTIVVNACTVRRNYSLGIYEDLSCSRWTNCIVWDNQTTDWYMRDSTNLVSYTATTGGVAGISKLRSLVTDGGGNLNANPLFADSVTGSWTAAGSYDPNLDRSTLIATNAAWTPNEHAGKAVWANTNSYYTYFYVVTNTATTLVVQARADGVATNTARYEIIDIHEKSKLGRYT